LARQGPAAGAGHGDQHPARAGLIDPALAAAATPWQRFKRGRPNELWQMDLADGL
jgi:hypothetical protein